jgi:hypothetical protein
MTAAISAACSFARGTRPSARTRRRPSSPGTGRWAPARCATWTAPATSACQRDTASGQPVPDGRWPAGDLPAVADRGARTCAGGRPRAHPARATQNAVRSVRAVSAAVTPAGHAIRRLGARSSWPYPSLSVVALRHGSRLAVGSVWSGGPSGARLLAGTRRRFGSWGMRGSCYGASPSASAAVTRSSSGPARSCPGGRWARGAVIRARLPRGPRRHPCQRRRSRSR